MLVPRIAVSELQGDFRVFVVADDGTVGLRSVQLGPEVDRLRLIESGLEPGEQVALEFMKLRPGMKVVPKHVALDAQGGVLNEPPKKEG